MYTPTRHCDLGDDMWIVKQEFEGGGGRREEGLKVSSLLCVLNSTFRNQIEGANTPANKRQQIGKTTTILSRDAVGNLLLESSSHEAVVKPRSCFASW